MFVCFAPVCLSLSLALRFVVVDCRDHTAADAAAIVAHTQSRFLIMTSRGKNA